MQKPQEACAGRLLTGRASICLDTDPPRDHGKDMPGTCIDTKAPGEARRNREGRSAMMLAMALLLLAVAVRVYGAWSRRVITDPDGGVAALMSKHIAEGSDLPVFFPGQSYMGSLEPMMGAVAMWVLGPSGFAANLGTVMAGLLALWVVMLWAREVGGWTGAAIAGGVMFFGSASAFGFQITPRGGYTMLLLLGSVLLLLTGRSAARAASEGRVSKRNMACIGLLAGLSWWTHPIAACHALTAGGVLLAALRLRALHPRIWLPGAAGFLAGAAPALVWNALNGWKTFALTDHVASTPWGLGFLTWGRRLARLLGFGEAPPLSDIGALLFAALIVAGLVRAAALARRRPWGSPQWHLLTAILFALILAWFYIPSQFAQFNTVRYLIPLLPSLAVIAAAVALFSRRWLRGGLLAAAIALPALQSPLLRDFHEDASAAADRMARAESMVRVARDAGVQALYADFHWTPLSFATGERVRFLAAAKERNDGYRAFAEAEDMVGVHDGHGWPENFVALSGGTLRWSAMEEGRGGLVTGALPPPANSEEIPAENWSIDGLTTFGRDGDRTLGDGRHDTIVAPPRHRLEERLALELDPPSVVQGVRLFIPRESQPKGLRVEAAAEDGVFRTVAATERLSPYAWSGPRFYPVATYPQVDCRFDPVTARLVRVVFSLYTRQQPLTVRQVQLFGPGRDATPTKADIERAGRELIEYGIDAVYAGRWESNRLHLDLKGRLATSRDPLWWPDDPDVLPPDVRLTPTTSFLVPADSVRMHRAALRHVGVTMTEEDCGPWTLFRFAPGQWRNDWSDASLRWFGNACLASD